MFYPEPRLLAVAYTRGRGSQFPPTPSSLASHPTRLDIAARILIAFNYLPRGPDCMKAVAVVVEGVDEGPFVGVFDCRCLPGRLRHREAYELVHSSLTGRGPCRRLPLGYDELLRLLTPDYTVIIMREGGSPLNHVRALAGTRVVYVLGTAVDPPKPTGIPFLEAGLGTVSYHADHVAAYIALYEHMRALGYTLA